jgi:hypothetical protein
MHPAARFEVTESPVRWRAVGDVLSIDFMTQQQPDEMYYTMHLTL